MAVKSTGVTLAGARAEFMQKLLDHKAAYKEIATRIPGRTKTEKQRFLGSTPPPRAMVNGRQGRGLRGESYDITDEQYESTLEIDREEYDDDQTGSIGIRIRELAVRSESFKDYLIALLLMNGGSSDALCYDGVSFFNQNHPKGQLSGSGGVQSNDVQYNVADPTQLTAQDFLSGVNAGVAAMMSLRDDHNMPVMLDDLGLEVIIPPILRDRGRVALNASIIGNTSNPFQGSADLRIFPWLNSGVEIFIVKKDGEVKPFIFQDRIPVEFEIHGVGSETTFNTGLIKAGTYARFAMAYGRYEYCVRVTFT